MQAINNVEVSAPSPFSNMARILDCDDWPEFNERGVYYQFSISQKLTISTGNYKIMNSWD